MKQWNKKLKSKKGMSLLEVLCCLLILLLVSSGLASGAKLAQDQYLKSIQTSQAEELYSTLKTILSNELQYTTSIHQDGNGNVETFYSTTYAIQSHETALVMLDDEGKEIDEAGQLALGYDGDYNRLLGSASYTNGLRAKISSFTYEDGYFEIEMMISVQNRVIKEGTFQVKVLNDLVN